MRLKDINAEITFDLWMKPERTEETPNIGIGYIAPNSTGQAYSLRIDDQQWGMVLRDQSDGKDLNFYLKRGCAHLAEVIQVAKDGSALVKIIFFNGEIVEIGDVEIGIDGDIESTAKENGINFNGIEKLGELLSEKCSIRVGGKTFFVMLAGKSSDIDFDSQDGEDQKNNLVEENYRAFSVHGENLRIPVQRKKLSRFEDVFLASRIIFQGASNKDGAVRLAHGNIKFASLPKKISAITTSEMKRLTQKAGSYLTQWDKYGRIEGELFLKKAKAIGLIRHNGLPEASQSGKVVKFFINEPPPKELELSDTIELTNRIPIYVINPDMNWDDYSSFIENEFEVSPEDKHKSLEFGNTSIKIVSISNKSIELELDTIPHMPYLVWSTKGEQTQIERRMKARKAILLGRSANPELGLLIEKKGIPSGTRRITKIKPLTPFVKEKIFKHPPTDRQVEALDVALNTPDIALIQGPPGTGKTTVVTAILERLNEEYDKTKSIRGQILVSGFQHDAVENIVSRLSVNALPTVKFGRRSGDSEFTVDAVTGKINKWCSGVAKNIRDKNPQIVQTEDQVRLGELFKAYSLCPSKNNIVSLMKRIIGLPRDVISEEHTNEAEEIINSLQMELKPNDLSSLRFVRALRVSEAAFVDDGAARAVDLLDKIEDESVNLDLSVLERAARWRSGEPLNFLPKLKVLKESLLYKYLPLPDFRTEKPRDDVLKLMATVSQLLEKKLNTTNKRDAILAEFLHELEDNPDGVREAIEDYNFVYAATTQQAVGKDIIRSKNKNVQYHQRTEMVKYDTVIIDEAARTSPRDLLIPMSLAEKRIILVGDHRQLPHLIDEEVARALEGDDSSGLPVDFDFVKKSMFEYLFNRLKKLEEKDGIKRTVTLDAQYRTHPLLGDFVSNNFYQKYNEGYRSPLSESYFGQCLQGIENKAAIWIDVPNRLGKEVVLPSRSRKRVAEAEVIAEYVNKWIGSEEGFELSFGVISFYKAQVFAVYKALQRFGITEREQDGTWQICPEFRFFENGEERIRIGTVDAFQGMEFDIVLLSMVRSQDMDALPPRIRNEKDDKKKQQKLFGHLMSKNRLCVSMSRQKKVLGIVGDGVFVNTQIAENAVPALKKYYELCHEQGIIL